MPVIEDKVISWSKVSFLAGPLPYKTFPFGKLQKIRQLVISDKDLPHNGVRKICDGERYDGSLLPDLPAFNIQYFPPDHHLSDLIHDLFNGNDLPVTFFSVNNIRILGSPTAGANS